MSDALTREGDVRAPERIVIKFGIISDIKLIV